MAGLPKDQRPKARVAKGFRDIGPDEIRGVRQMLAKIQEVYEAYGFEPAEQPFIEYTDALGKFLPDQDRPNAGVFSFQDDDDQWLSLRYDLTAPLARYVAENQQSLPTPYRSYRQGWVFRNEKPGPGRYRQFMQFDADTVGSASPAADAEVCMMAADTMEALGLCKGQYVVKVNNRKILDGVMEAIGISGVENAPKRLVVLRAIDKLDRLGHDGVLQLLGKGRKDESGDYTPGAGLGKEQIDRVSKYLALTRMRFFDDSIDVLDQAYAVGEVAPVKYPWGEASFPSNAMFKRAWLDVVGDTNSGLQGIGELQSMDDIFTSAGFGTGRIYFDATVVRGLEYYTGPVFECELLIPTTDEDGRPVRFGSVGGGGRYDDLVARFTGQPVPATGFSFGVSRLYKALERIGKAQESSVQAPVVVLVMDKERQGDYWRMVMELRAAGIRAEMYVGTSGMKAQMKYADKRGSPLVIIQGGDEKAKDEVQIKDLRLGAELAAGIATREEYKEQRLAQFSVPEGEMVAAVRKALGR